jgi:hydrogenase-1 operon protein HyaF
MVTSFTLPPVGFGPGSQPPDGDDELTYMSMPQDMRTFAPRIPEVENPGLFGPAFDLLAAFSAACGEVAGGAAPVSFDLAGLDAANRRLIAETLGEGEVSIRMHGVPAVAAQESVFAGLWILKGAGVDRAEVAPVPTLARERAFAARRPATLALAARRPGVVNAPSLLAELMDKSLGYRPGQEIHVVNLTLLPHTEEDLAWLDEALGEGAVTILSRGYGNCRITATAQAHVWRVQFYNSMDVLILDTFEVTAMPEVVLAAAEDLADSAGRLREVLEAIR